MIETNHWLNQLVAGLPAWKWLVLLTVFILSVVFSSVFRFIAKKIKNLSFIRKNEEGFWRHYVRLDIDRPFAWVMISLIWLLVIDALEIPVKADKYLVILTKITLAINIVRMVYYAMDALGEVLKAYTAKTPSTMDDHLAPLAVKSGKVFVVIVGALIVLQNLNVDVTSLIAGLGIGGLAIALAAQDAVANLIGSVMIILDRPFSIGDAVKVNDVEGTIEAIGFRSTRIRTVYNSLVTIPNSSMAKDKIDNMGLRPYRRIRQILGVHYDTSPELIEHFCTRVKYLISQEPAVVKETIQVAFHGFADSTLNILVNFHIAVFEANEELERQQKIFCEILEAAKEMNVIFAYPTQTVYYMANPAETPKHT
jgi:MscS family membrane protein